jgi:hypothetical protein
MNKQIGIRYIKIYHYCCFDKVNENRSFMFIISLVYISVIDFCKEFNT